MEILTNVYCSFLAQRIISKIIIEDKNAKKIPNKTYLSILFTKFNKSLAKSMASVLSFLPKTMENTIINNFIVLDIAKLKNNNRAGIVNINR